VQVSAGPRLGGLIAEPMSWRRIFYLNVPLGVLALLAMWRVLGNVGRCATFVRSGRGRAARRRVRHPIIDPTLLDNRVFASALLSMTLAGASFGGATAARLLAD
jgi:predicted MFS family arabinose efflux permease